MTTINDLVYCLIGGCDNVVHGYIGKAMDRGMCKKHFQALRASFKAGKFVTIEGRPVFIGGPGGGGGGSGGGSAKGQAAIDSGAAMQHVIGALESEDWNVPFVRQANDDISVTLVAIDSEELQLAMQELEFDVTEAVSDLGVAANMFVDALVDNEAEIIFELVSLS